MDQFALVTGANKGIGQAIAAQLADAGYTVYLGSRDAGRGKRAAEAIAGDGRDLRMIELDVIDQASVDAAAARISNEIGRLDVLVNNAGISVASRQAPSETSADDMTASYATNVIGVVRATNAMLPLLRLGEHARIVNITSDLGSLQHLAAEDHPMGAFPLLMAYNSSKTALNAITLHYAKELADTPISVHAVSPGYVATDLNHHSGTATPDQGARVPVAIVTDPDRFPDLLISDIGTGETSTTPW